MKEKIDEIASEIEQKVINYRRDFHKYPETGWIEFRTASKVAGILAKLGYELKMGKEVISKEDRMGLPSEKIFKKEFERAKDQGADLKYIDNFEGGFTGLVGILKNGPGPTIAFRFDIDGVDVSETNNRDHQPVEEGFKSKNEGAMHACGHDGHTAIGLGLAEVLMKIKDEFSGTIKLIFQPAEEGVRGARSMAKAGVVEDVDYLIGLHLGLGVDNSEVYAGTKGFLATSKFDAYFDGEPAHAGAQPELGNNALLAAANAVSNLYAISRHSQGVTRINVGKLNAGSGRNVIPAKAHLVIETRGETSELNNYMYNQAQKVLKNSTQMYDVDFELKSMGGAESGKSDPELQNRIKSTADKLTDFNKVYEETATLGGSEDFTYFMKDVQKNGGLTTFIILGTKLKGAHHKANFDFDERSLVKGVKLLSNLVLDLSK